MHKDKPLAPDAPGHVETIRLFGWVTDHAEAMDRVRPRLFGELVKRTNIDPTYGYHGDLYHDALQIEREVNGPCEFDFLARFHGTHIGFDHHAFNWARGAAKMEKDTDTSVLYRVALTVDDRGEWYVTFTVLDKATL